MTPPGPFPRSLPELRKAIEAFPFKFGLFNAWLLVLDMREAPPSFVPRDECNCPVACFFREIYGIDGIFIEGAAEPVTIGIGDDDISLDGIFVYELPREWRDFVHWFDLEFAPSVANPAGRVSAHETRERWLKSTVRNTNESINGLVEARP